MRQSWIHSLLFFCYLLFSQNLIAQTKTAAELKAERDVLRSEMRSKEAQERKEKMEKLSNPGQSGVGSVDGLASNSTAILNSTKDINKQVPEMYKRTVGETVDGVTDVTVKKPTLEELTSLAATISTQIKAVAEASENVKNASEDVKNAKPIQAPKATKSLNYSKDVLAVTGPELQQSLKVVENLIATLKSSKNL